MKKKYTYIVSALLLILFVCRIVIPVCLHYAADAPVSIDQQQEEKPDDTASNHILDEADLPVAYIAVIMEAGSMISFPVTSHALPPVHYMSIPTPPPWYKS